MKARHHQPAIRRVATPLGSPRDPIRREPVVANQIAARKLLRDDVKCNDVLDDSCALRRRWHENQRRPDDRDPAGTIVRELGRKNCSGPNKAAVAGSFIQARALLRPGAGKSHAAHVAGPRVHLKDYRSGSRRSI
jgi:hypothetical protein